MTKQTTDQTPASSSRGRYCGERSRTAKSSRGAIEIQPTGTPSSYASSPGSLPARTIAPIRRLFSATSPLERCRQYMHQQPDAGLFR
jgi:hypothetical protein